jgi:hypothetical protein
VGLVDVIGNESDHQDHHQVEDEANKSEIHALI